MTGTTSEIIDKIFDQNKYDVELLNNLARYSGLDFTQKSFAQLIDQDQRIWRTVQTKNISQKKLYKHLTGEYTIALPIYPYSKYLIIDIDNRSQFKHTTAYDVLIELKRDFGEPDYLEYSQDSKGYHVYYHMKDWVEKEAKLALENEYISRGFIVEVIGEGKKIRVPYSDQYQTAWDRQGNSITSIEELHDNFEKVYNCDSSYKTSIPAWLKKYNKKGKAIQKLRTSITQNTQYQQTQDRTYGCGTRHIEQINIGFNSIREKHTFEQFKEMCEYWNDGTSKDMKLPEYKKEKILKNVWEWCNKNYQETPEYESGEGGIYDEYGNLVFLNSMEYSFSDYQYELLEKVFTHYYETYNIGKIGGKLESTFIHNAIVLLEGIWSKTEYDKKTQALYSQKEFKKLSNATLFNSELKKLMCDQLGIKNYRRMWSFLELTQSIKPAKIGKYSYSYKGNRFAKHYTVSRTSTIYNKYLYNKNHMTVTINSYSNIDTNNNTKNYNCHPFPRACKKKNINYSYKFFQLTDGKLTDRLEKVRLWKGNLEDRNYLNLILQAKPPDY